MKGRQITSRRTSKNGLAKVVWISHCFEMDRMMKRWIVIGSMVATMIFLANTADAAEEGVRSRCYRCGISFCFSYAYKTNAPRTILRRWRSQVGFWRSRYLQVPNTRGRWTKWFYGGKSLSGYAYMEHHLLADPGSPSRIASSQCSHY